MLTVPFNFSGWVKTDIDDYDRLLKENNKLLKENKKLKSTIGNMEKEGTIGIYSYEELDNVFLTKAQLFRKINK